MEDITRLSERMHKLDVDKVAPAPTKSAFPCSTISANPIGPNSTTSTTPSTTPEDKFKALTKSSRDTNPFYDPKIDLQAAAIYLHKILHTALGACEAWLKVPVDRIIDKSGNKSPFMSMCRDFNHILFFLQHGRHGFDLTFLPSNCFADVEGLLPVLLFKVEQLSEIQCCASLYKGAASTLREVKVRLGEIKDQRTRIWLQSKDRYERRQDEVEGSYAILPGFETKRILALVSSSGEDRKAGLLDEPKLNMEVDLSFTEKDEYLKTSEKKTW